MKILAFISGALSIIIIVIGTLFKIMHWPFGNSALLLGTVIFAFIFIPSLARYLYINTK